MVLVEYIYLPCTSMKNGSQLEIGYIISSLRVIDLTHRNTQHYPLNNKNKTLF
jgi:hypothetical protein